MQIEVYNGTSNGTRAHGLRCKSIAFTVQMSMLRGFWLQAKGFLLTSKRPFAYKQKGFWLQAKPLINRRDDSKAAMCTHCVHVFLPMSRKMRSFALSMKKTITALCACLLQATAGLAQLYVCHTGQYEAYDLRHSARQALQLRDDTQHVGAYLGHATADVDSLTFALPDFAGRKKGWWRENDTLPAPWRPARHCPWPAPSPRHVVHLSVVPCARPRPRPRHRPIFCKFFHIFYFFSLTKREFRLKVLSCRQSLRPLQPNIFNTLLYKDKLWLNN